MNVFDRMVSLFEADFQAAQDWFTGEVLPFVENFFKTTIEAEIVALRPLAEEALAELGVDLPAMLAGGLPAVATLAGQVLLSTALKVEAVGLAVAQASLHATVASVISNAQAKVEVSPAPEVTGAAV